MQELKDGDRELIWHPFTQMREYQLEEPLIIQSAEDCYLIDIEGRRYIDGISSLWVNVHGHRKAKIDQAVRGQLDEVAHSTLLGFGNVPSILLAKKLLEIAPQNLKKVFYSDSGSTAVEIALKMAFQYWQHKGEKQKQLFVTLENAYHGDTIGSVSVGGMQIFHDLFRPLLFKTIAVPDFDIEQLRKVFLEQAHEIAACVIEPMIQGAAGMRLQPPGFVSAVRELCDEFNVLMICDEVATGFGRTGKMFAVEHDSVRPDLLCLAKGITGGYLPLAATLTTQEVYSAFEGSYAEFKTFFHGHSYTGNPLACAAALANLEIFEEEKTLQNLPEKIALIAHVMEKVAEQPCVKEVRQLGMMVGIELAQANGESFPMEQRIANQVCKEAIQQGVLLRPLGDVVVLMPPLGIQLQTLQVLLEITHQALISVLSQRVN
ncbi:MAG: adenosylmethionine--8-amino-7-oxononanoate transaminase [Deltaproteobacteria bacterium]|nr:adenosylmethionine--8-amino-7-oxononanoate transaminase [Deltaproteobacteria bacterium]